MAISSEFAQAVRDNNLLRVRIMLKDSLLIDKSFYLFDEMQAYASAQGTSPWADADIPLEKAGKPWSEDTMNYELTALVNDFTKEHVNYVKAIITDLYKTSALSRREIPSAQSAQNVPSPRKNEVPQTKTVADPFKVILTEIKNINNILKKNIDEYTGKRQWYYKDIESIKLYAQKIVDACDEIQRRRG